jgi:hypothetical protein
MPWYVQDNHCQFCCCHWYCGEQTQWTVWVATSTMQRRPRDSDAENHRNTSWEPPMDSFHFTHRLLCLGRNFIEVLPSLRGCATTSSVSSKSRADPPHAVAHGLHLSWRRCRQSQSGRPRRADTVPRNQGVFEEESRGCALVNEDERNAAATLGHEHGRREERRRFRVRIFFF